MDFPKISIVTPSYNQGQFIEQTILSVLNQNYPNLEYIIIDGGSTDSTVNVIKKYEHRLKYWISEKDRGQADAINKGLQFCTGEVFNFINSDDYLAEGALYKIAEAFADIVTGIVAGTVSNINEEGIEDLWVNKNLEIEKLLKNDSEVIYHQPGVWLRTEIVKKVGEFNIDYRYCFDQEHFYKYLLYNNKVCYLPDVLAFFRLHKDSKTVKESEFFFWEFNKMFKAFWNSQSGTPLENLAKRRSMDYEWPLLNGSINRGDRGRLKNFLLASKAIMNDPKYRLNKKSIGWLKHILLGEKNKMK
ncbi:MAG TPA: glycosyltransferase family 2 protein [Hanamia sp.]